MRQTMKPALERRDAEARLERRVFSFEVRATGEDGTIEGYGSVFGVKDSYDDVIEAGAFSESLKAHKAAGTMPAMLWQHDSSAPIGVWEEMSEDAKGLKVRGRLALTTAKGREAYELIKMGALKGLSIGFVATAKSYNDADGVRTLMGIDLWEVSVVTFPANGKALLTGVKSAPVEKILKPSDAERWLRDAAPNASKADVTAFVSRVMRMGEERREAAQSAAEVKRAADRLLASLTLS